MDAHYHSTDSKSINNPNVIFKERWEGILECKKRFLNETTYDPHTCTYLSKEIADSWVRSRNLKVDPNKWVLEHKLKSEEFVKVVEKNRKLLDIVRPVFKIFEQLVSGYHMSLMDENGTVVLMQGSISSEFGLERFGAEGLCWNEKNVGTTSYLMCKQIKKPVQLLGPEFYCLSFLEVLTSSAAPILNEYGEVLATLSLTYRPVTLPWDENTNCFYSYNTLALVTAIAVAIEAQLNLKNAHDNLAIEHGTLEAILGVIDEGIITVDCMGNIIHSNYEGNRILELDRRANTRNNIKEYLGKQSKLMNIIENSKSAVTEESISLGSNNEQSYIINIEPILEPGSPISSGAVLRLNRSEKINAMVGRRGGTTAVAHFTDIIGESNEIKKTIALGKRFARSSENILLVGESGTGKEIFAQAIHNSYCPDGPFIPINCAAMPRNLIESELFGYEAGSFTGADRSGKPGKIELANGGTLFLDEIGDMPYELQAVLLRVLQDKQVMRVGGQRYKKVDFRIIAATNKPLYKMVKENLFREDLYFRLSVLTIMLPPLRDREGDKDLFADYFVHSYCKKMHWNPPQISDSARKMINKYRWPGNVRQLENAIIYAINTTQTDLIDVDDLPVSVCFDDVGFAAEEFGEANSLKSAEIKAIKAALNNTNDNVPAAAKLLNISKSTLYRKMREYNIDY
jgi:transcriptional regulator with PAS, ATPase and Fis domain